MSMDVYPKPTTPVTDTTDYRLELAKGNISGHTHVHKFGNARDFDTGDGAVTVHGLADDGTAWEQMNYVYSTTADIDSLSSDNAGDGQVIEIQGLDTNWDLTTQEVTLNGTTRVALGTALIRVFRMKNLGATDNAGNIFCFVNTADTTPADGVPDDATKIRAIIHAGDNQTLMAIFTIPNGKTGYMDSFYASTHGGSKATAYDIELLTRNNTATPSGVGVFQLKHTSALRETGSSEFRYEYHIPERIAAKTDIEMRAAAEAAGVTEASISAGFDLILVDN